MNKAKWREVIEITTGVILMSVGFYFFLLPFNLIIGGVMGVSVILQDVIPISIFHVYRKYGFTNHWTHLFR